MIPALLAVCLGLTVLVWSADRFVESSACIARALGVSPLLIGIILVGFGTSAPELAVSAISAIQGSPGIALGNAYGSNIANIALILGITALLRPISITSHILRTELPLLAGATALAGWQLADGAITRLEAAILLGCFILILLWIVRQDMQRTPDPLEEEVGACHLGERWALGRATVEALLGLGLLIASSRALVWGAVRIAQLFGVSDVLIGLTIVAVGTSLPELAASIAAFRKRGDDLAVGNIIGSNIFNTLAVVGLSAAIHPLAIPPEIFHRDLPLMAGLTLILFPLAWGFGRPGRINRWEGGALLVVYAGYVTLLGLSI